MKAFAFPNGKQIKSKWNYLSVLDLWTIGTYALVGEGDTGKTGIALDIASSFLEVGIPVIYFDFQQILYPPRLQEHHDPNFIIARPFDSKDILGILEGLRSVLSSKPVLFIFDDYEHFGTLGDDDLELNINSYVAEKFARSASLLIKRTRYQIKRYSNITATLVVEQGPLLRKHNSYELFGRYCSIFGPNGPSKYIIDYRTGRPSWAYDLAMEEVKQKSPRSTFSIEDYSRTGAKLFVVDSPLIDLRKCNSELLL